MSAKPIQLAIQHNGVRYGGIYSVSGNLMIARIPGIDSRSRTVDGADQQQLARALLQEILESAQRSGRLAG